MFPAICFAITLTSSLLYCSITSQNSSSSSKVFARTSIEGANASRLYSASLASSSRFIFAISVLTLLNLRISVTSTFSENFCKKKKRQTESRDFTSPSSVHRFCFYIDKLYSRFTVRHPRKTPGRFTPDSMQSTVPLSFSHEQLYFVFHKNCITISCKIPSGFPRKYSYKHLL